MIHAQLPLRMPCYDFTHITDLTLAPTFSPNFLFGKKVGVSGTASSLGVTGSEYKTQERIHRHIADWRLLAIPTS